MNTDETPPANPLAPFHTLQAPPLTNQYVIHEATNQPAAEPPWRPLEPGEIIQEGDEVAQSVGDGNVKWVPCNQLWLGQPAISAYFRTRRPPPSAPPDSGQAGSPEEIEEIEAHAKAVYHVGAALLRIDGDEGDPCRPVYSSNPMPEPYGSAWQAYEGQASVIVELLGAPTAEKLAAPHLATPTEPEPAPAQTAPPIKGSALREYRKADLDAIPDSHCIDCAPDFIDCWTDGSKCIKCPMKAPDQTAREWVEDKLERIETESHVFFALRGPLARELAELAERADRAEAEIKQARDGWVAAEKALECWMEKNSRLMRDKVNALADYGQEKSRADRAEAELSELRANVVQCALGEPCDKHSGANFIMSFPEFHQRIKGCHLCQLDERDALKAERDRLREAITFIKELNATTNQHGRHYRSRCGQFLAKLNQTNQ